MAANSAAKQSKYRISFTKLREPLQALNLLGLQVESFDWLLGSDAWEARVEAAQAFGYGDVPDVSGPEEIFHETSPIENVVGTMSLSSHDHRLESPKYSMEGAKAKDYIYSAPMYITAEFMNYGTGEIKSQTVLMGDFPLMTPRGTFITNGTERVVVSWLVRLPGVYFEKLSDRLSDKEVFGAKVTPSRGTWLEFEINKRDAVGMRIDRKRKQSVTHFLKAVGMTESEIHETFAAYPVLLETLEKDTVVTWEEALLDICRKLRPGKPANVDAAQTLLNNFYFDSRCYDLAKVGRHKINKKLAIEADPKVSTLFLEDIVATVKYLFTLHQGDKTFAGTRNGGAVEVCAEVDDIDNSANRRTCAVDELIQGQVCIGLACMERTVHERMTTQETDSITPQTLINIRPVVTAIKEFFGTSQFSQLMDQSDPLAGLTYKRRLSALGPGGLSRDCVGMEVRDVHPLRHGRICPIEPPEGSNIGLIGSLVTFARTNPLGLVETSYRVVKNGKVIDEICYLIADDEKGHHIAQASPPLEAGGSLAERDVPCRVAGDDPILIAYNHVDYMDVSTRQVVPTAAAFIPFLEHDDANRALMGANMQRQAVPLLTTEVPPIGTGTGMHAAYDSGEMVLAIHSDVISEVSADLIVISTDEGGYDSCRLEEFKRSSPGNYTSQRIIVDEGGRVEVGDVLADGLATSNGEVAFGKNLLVAYMLWEGLNYEDVIILSRRVVEEDILTSIHIEEYEVNARETKLGEEEIIRDIPNVSEESLADLDECGIIRIGAEVTAGDILVGKATPKGETELTSEGRLLRAIFGEKAREARGTSLRVPHGEKGIVIGVHEFNDDQDDLNPSVRQTVRVYAAQRHKIMIGDKMAGRHDNRGVVSRILPVEDMPFLADGTLVDIILNPLGAPGRMNVGQMLEYHPGWLTHQGWGALAAIEVGEERATHLPAGGIKTGPGTPVATPVSDGLEVDELAGLLCNVNPNRDDDVPTNYEGKARLFDGRSGELFPYPISVDYTYMLRLHHPVDNKIHARSTGPYSMITQQPLGGKAQFSSQRFGEMEVWALEAYGTAYVLQELLTIKSDDATGRVRVYETTVKGEDIPEPGISESFRVLIREVRSLCLNVEALDMAGNVIDLREQDEDFNACEDLGITLEARSNAAATIDVI